MFGEPAPTQGDIHFSLFGYPVRIHPLFWLVGVLLWVPAVLVGILVHELGHAVVMGRFGARSHIVLYGMGGLAVPEGSYWRQPKAFGRILISLAGPGAGFLLAGIVVAGFMLAGRRVLFLPIWHMPVLPMVFFEPFQLAWFLNNLLYVCVFWGLFNLLPIYPLDGGHATEDFLGWINPRNGVRQAMFISMVTAGGLAVWQLVNLVRSAGAGLGQGSIWGLYIVVLFGYLAYLSYLRLQEYGRGPWW